MGGWGGGGGMSRISSSISHKLVGWGMGVSCMSCVRWGDELYELWGWGVGDELLEGKGFAL